MSEIKEECKELTPRSELSGITDNNISENDFIVQEAGQRQKKDTESAFLQKHEILPNLHQDAQYWNDTYLDVARAIWSKRETKKTEMHGQSALTIFNDKNSRNFRSSK